MLQNVTVSGRILEVNLKKFHYKNLKDKIICLKVITFTYPRRISAAYFIGIQLKQINLQKLANMQRRR